MMALIVSAALLTLLVMGSWFRRRRVERIRRRLVPPAPPGSSRPATGEGIGRTAVELTAAAGLQRLGTFYGPLLLRAGVYSPWSGAVFATAKLLSVAGFIMGWIWLADVSTWSAGQTGIFVGGLLAIILIPDLVLWSLVRERKMRLQHGLPEWLDLHTTLVEGGMGFDAALARIVVETEGIKDPIFQELGIVHREILMGTSRAAALRRMADRTHVEEIDQVVMALTHAERLGAGITNALRPQADMIRNRVWEEARARAERLGTKLLFPIFMGSLPVFFVLVVLPLVLRFAAGIKGIQR